jgi:UDP-N-acetylglucosamine--dolichyl-phosphate N-acetylglucosaminephosphotransferase
MAYLLLTSVLVSFLLVVFMMPYWIKKARVMGLIGRDINKYSKPEVAEAGGIVVLAGFIIGVLTYVAIRTFVFEQVNSINLEIFVLISSVLMVGFIGIVDSLLAASSNFSEVHHSKKWRRGISNKYRILLCLFAAVPLMVINAGTSSMSIPFLGTVNFGILYPLFLIPLGVIGTTTTYNFLAGYNGLEAGQGILVLGFLSYVAYVTGSTWLALIGLCMVSALIGFYLFNKAPAKVFPSDVLTYPIGALIAIMAILGNFEKIAFVVFIPYVIEVILKSRGGLKKHSFGKPKKDGTLDLPYDKIYGLEHLAIWALGRGATERKVTYLIHAFQILFILIAFLML